jgi:BioD-like phosphotransacetylase family protein
LYIVSAEAGAGKTAAAAGIGRALLGEGKKVGYLNPVLAARDPESAEADARFMKQMLDLPEKPGALCPRLDGERRLADRAREAYIEVAQNRDVVLIESYCGKGPEEDISKVCYQVAEAVKAGVVAVESYAQGSKAPRFSESYAEYGKNLLGVIANKVPVSRLTRFNEEVAPGGPRVLGIIPEDRMLAALSVGELAEHIGGKVIAGEEKSKELVENLMAGAMVVDSGLDYFGRKESKAVVLRSDRPDMQMAALETSTRCLVITGGGEPLDYVSMSAGNKGVPIILTEHGTDAVIQRIEEALDRARFRQEKKLNRLGELLQQHLDLPALFKGLGLPAKNAR